MPILSLIAAIADSGIIGRNNDLPWRLPADLAHFKQVTLDKPIIMGRRTWESLPGLLPRRQHLVLSRDPDYRAEGCVLVPSLEAAIAAAGMAEEVFVVGGASLYAEAIPRADRLYLTLVHAKVEGDTSFPDWDRAQWNEVGRVERLADDRNAFAMSFVELRRAS